MDGLDIDNILSEDEAFALFSDEIVDNSTEKPEENKVEETPKDNEEKDTAEIDPEDLFGESESVGSEENNKDGEGTKPKGNGTSPNFYSSIASALRDEGIFPDLDDDTISKVLKPEDFRDLIENQIQAGLDDRQKKINEALGVGVTPSDIVKYDNTIKYLDSIKDSTIEDEGEQGEMLRKNLIYQDFINRGYSKERAEREVNKSFNAGTDIEDAKESLASNKEFFTEQYNSLVKEHREKDNALKKKREADAEKLKNSILNDDKVFGELSIDTKTRQKVFDTVYKPVYKDPDTGTYMTALQKYQKENETDFIKNVGLVYTLTNGFKNLDGLVKNKVSKELKKGIKDLERTLNNTNRASDGGLQFITGVNTDPNSYIGKGWSLDI